VIRNEGAIPFLGPVEHASRYAAPLALLLLDFWPPRLKSHLGRTVASMWILRVAAAATFAGHGLVAIDHSLHGGHFAELLQSACGALGIELTPSQNQWGLAIIGGLDLGLALNVLVSRSKPVVFYMMLWGLATAASRMALLGPQGYPEMLIRIANGGIPLVLLLYWSLSLKDSPAEIVKAN
jgi:hypothetical protein